jgi:hypothetical protein
VITDQDQFWCPTHGRRRWQAGAASQYDEAGHGPYIPYYDVRCRQCGQRGAFVCDGTQSGVCLVEADGACLYHLCFTGQLPFPRGLDATRRWLGERNRAYYAAERQRDEGMGLSHGGSGGAYDLDEVDL